MIVLFQDMFPLISLIKKKLMALLRDSEMKLDIYLLATNNLVGFNDDIMMALTTSRNIVKGNS